MEQIPVETRKTNATDPDSRITKTRNGWIQGYNAQAIATRHHIMVGCDVSQDANDAKQLEPRGLPGLVLPSAWSYFRPPAGEIRVRNVRRLWAQRGLGFCNSLK